MCWAKTLSASSIRTLYQVGESGRSIKDQRTYSADYKKYFEQTIVYDKTAHLFICILRDVTDVEVARAKHEELSRTTAEIADKVVDKQMRIVQEIASLLARPLRKQRSR